MPTPEENLILLGLDLDVLEAEPDIFKSQVKKAYRSKAIEHHPDKGGDPEMFRKCVEAYENLIDPSATGEEPESEHDVPDAASRKINGRWTPFHNPRLIGPDGRRRSPSTLGTTRSEQYKCRERGPTTFYVVNDSDGGRGVYSFPHINRLPLTTRRSTGFFENGTVVVAVEENKDFIQIGNQCWLPKRDLTTLDGTRVVPLPARSVSKRSQTRTTSVLDQSVAAESAESAAAARDAQQMDPRCADRDASCVREFSFSPCLDRMLSCFDSASLKNKGYTKKKRKSKKRKTKKKKHTSKKRKSKKYTKKRK
jgi:curved DNA-binding protein CbpA